MKLSLDSFCLEPGIIQCHVTTKTLQTVRQRERRKSSIITPLNTVLGREREKKSVLRYELFKSRFEICIPAKKAFELNRAGLEEKLCWMQTLLMYISWAYSECWFVYRQCSDKITLTDSRCDSTSVICQKSAKNKTAFVGEQGKIRAKECFLIKHILGWVTCCEWQNIKSHLKCCNNHQPL